MKVYTKAEMQAIFIAGTKYAIALVSESITEYHGFDINISEMGHEVAHYWVVEHGCDCDGSYTRGQVYPFDNEVEAIDCLEKEMEFSDGMKYELITSIKGLIEYCNEFGINYENCLLT